MGVESTDRLFTGRVLVVDLLPDVKAARKEYRQQIDPKQATKTFGMMDQLLAGKELIPSRWAESVRKMDMGLIWEVKAPQNSRRGIGRLLCFAPNTSRWHFYVAYASLKKDQALPQSWIDTAEKRVKGQLQKGWRG